MDIHVSLVGRRNLTGEIYAQLRSAILEGRLRGGDQLPPTRELARLLSVSRTTVTVAYDRLISEGYARARTGSGTFVSHHAVTNRRPRPVAAGALLPRRGWPEIVLPTRLDRTPDFDFRSGDPDIELFPYGTWRSLVARQFRPPSLRGGAYSEPAGMRQLRESIARHVGTARGVRASAADIVVTNGTQQAVHLIARVMLGAHDRVAVEDPGYAPPRRQFAERGAVIEPVPVDREGIVVDAIPNGTRLVYVTPSHQYPLGISMSLARRMALLAWARRHDAAIVEDDYDSEFRFGGRPIEPLQMLDTSGRVIYVGSFSKTVLPALRLGFVVVPPSLRGAVEAAKFLSDWHSPLALQAALTGFIDSGQFARHVRRMRRVYQTRHEIIVRTLMHDFSEEFEVIRSAVGLHVCALARTASTERIDTLVRSASTAGVECQSLSMFTIRAPLAGIVLGYGAIPTARIEEGLARLHGCLDSLET